MMIKNVVYNNEVYEDYFIDSETSVITDKNGKIKHQSITNGYYTVKINNEPKYVHRIMACTFKGYIKGLIVHHNDGNKLNNALSNLDYSMTKSIHSMIHGLNKQVSEETRQKLSSAQKGRSAWNKGKTLSEEHKRKISEAEKGRKRAPLSDEVKKKISNALKTRK